MPSEDSQIVRFVVDHRCLQKRLSRIEITHTLPKPSAPVAQLDRATDF